MWEEMAKIEDTGGSVLVAAEEHTIKGVEIYEAWKMKSDVELLFLENNCQGEQVEGSNAVNKKTGYPPGRRRKADPAE